MFAQVTVDAKTSVFKVGVHVYVIGNNKKISKFTIMQPSGLLFRILSANTTLEVSQSVSTTVSDHMRVVDGATAACAGIQGPACQMQSNTLFPYSSLCMLLKFT